jgi:hypothetical protein
MKRRNWEQGKRKNLEQMNRRNWEQGNGKKENRKHGKGWQSCMWYGLTMRHFLIGLVVHPILQLASVGGCSCIIVLLYKWEQLQYELSALLRLIFSVGQIGLRNAGDL